VKAVDASVLLLALRRTAPRHVTALSLVRSLAEGRSPWGLPWPALYEAVRAATDGALYHPPMSVAQARADLAALTSSPTLVLLSEGERHAEILDHLLSVAAPAGPMLAGARIAALCLEHGVEELYSADLDLMRYPGLRVTHPFLGDEDKPVSSSPRSVRSARRAAKSRPS
jgi:predicted nucleic acid-binding protein